MKLYGYISALLGLAFIAISPKKFIELTPLKGFIPPSFLLIGGIILVGVGVILVMSESKTKSRLGQEVPILKGKNIVGYRVIK